MKLKVKPSLFLFLRICFLLVLASSVWPESLETLEATLRHFQAAIENVDFSAYSLFFLPEIGQAEAAVFDSYFSNLGMDGVVVHRLPGIKERAGEHNVFLYVFFQNSYAALVETWRLSLVLKDGEWRIASRNVVSRLRNLYRLKLPSSRWERVEKITIDHEDINLTFHKALVFYDNLPDVETALLIIGPGRMTFEPSDENEKHQLQLLYKTKSLFSEVDHAYLRFSPSFFSRHIRIDGARQAPPPSARELEQATTYFDRYQDNFFTVENSLTRELLTVLPQGEEAVIEFRSPKLGELTYIFSPFAEDEISLYDRRRDRFICLYTPREKEQGRPLRFFFGQSFDVLHYDMDTEVDPSNFYLSAKVKVSLTSSSGGVETLRFRLNPKLNLIRILDEEGRELMFNQDRSNRMVYVPLIEPPAGKAVTLEFFYQGRLEPPPSHTDVVLAGQSEEPRIVVPLKFESLLYSYSAAWYPSPPHEDYFTARVKLTAPAEMTCLGQGLLLEKGYLVGRGGEKSGARQDKAYWLYESKTPLKYLAFLVGKLEFLREDRTLSGLPLELFSSQEFRLNWRGSLEEAAAILSFYERQFGRFPYENLRIVLRFWETKGGHSPGSLVVLNQLPRSLSSQGVGSISFASPVDLSRWPEYFLAHEIAHQWWGQAVTWRRYRDQWLSEGLAQFSTVLFLKEKYGVKAYTDILRQFARWTEKKSRWGPVIMGSRLSYLDFEAFQTIIYNKTSIALNLLCELLGEEVFFRGLKEFVANFRFRSASTRDFFQTMEKVSGVDLKAYMQSWFEKHTLPRLRLQTSTEVRGGQPFFTVKIEQLEDIFIFPLWLEWKEGTTVRREKVVVREKNQEFSFPLKAKPRQFKVDPERIMPADFD
ncbi:MAG: M1 family metallopeptidase [Candidatus Aminicenantales bacterium]